MGFCIRLGMASLCICGLSFFTSCESPPLFTSGSDTRDRQVGRSDDDAEVASDGERRITFIHTGDFHGSLHPHPNFRADSNGLLEGGLARVYTVVQNIRRSTAFSFHVHTGDTIAGGPEATFTRGQALVDVVNRFGIDVFTPGNWEFAYGVDRFLYFFGGENPRANWNTVAANAFYTGGEPYNNKVVGENLVQPFRIFTVNGVKLGIFGCTTNRGPTIVSSDITKGVEFSACKGTTINAGTPEEKVIPPEIPYYVDLLRNERNVDLVILLSEAGLAENIWNAERYDGIDIIFSSDMHEETAVPIVVNTPNGGKTLIVEEGEDGNQVGELTVELDNRRISEWKWVAHKIDERIRENEFIADLIEDISEPFLSEDFEPGRFVNPYNGARLMEPLDKVIGYTDIPIERNAFSNAANPALLEGTGHDLIADAFRVMTGAQIGAIRGFRYTNSIAPGPITYGDLYHYIPIGPMVAVAEIRGAQLNGQIENSANSCMDPDVTNWLGGWLFNFSGITFDINPYLTLERSPISAGRAFNLMLDNNSDGIGDVPVSDSDASTYYSYASYFYLNSPDMVNRISIDEEKIAGIKVLAKGNNDELILLSPAEITPENVVGAVEVVARYLKTLPDRRITSENLPFPRIKLVGDLPLPDTTKKFGFPVIEPLYGMDPSKY
ncbi:MAG: 5'-nucleotidase C-terminal domain-containing protein [Gammaproteobacteria bacterium]|nr:5'-nucleotidase C-terminal domain-containing protein [Gammaproteobacteria bacterium]